MHRRTRNPFEMADAGRGKFAAVEGWLRGDVAAAYGALKADPARVVSVGRVKARLAAVHKKATAKA